MDVAPGPYCRPLHARHRSKYAARRFRSQRTCRQLPEHGGEIKLKRLGALNLTAVTDAEASPDEKSVVVRTSHEAVFYRSADLIRGEAAPYLRIPLDGLMESQGEGIAVDATGMLYLASEGRPWRRAGRLLGLRCRI